MKERRTEWLVMGMALAVASCTGGDVDDGPARTANAAEAVPGSCSLDDCGAQSPDGCWCDELCESYGDCCADVADVCAGDGCAPVLCEIYCPFGNAVDDQGCELCACKPSWDCAGFWPQPCPEEMVCVDVAGDDCDPAAGGADCPGTCVPADDPECPSPEAYCDAVCGGGAIPEVPIGCPIPDCACPEPPAGSCEGVCGGADADADCWCDDSCAQYGDCCPDKAAVCDGATCAGRCDEYDAGAACQCDDGCAAWGDCCTDFDAVCSGCSYAGEVYGVGDTFPDVDGCNTCTCTAGGHVACTEIGCATCEYEGEVYGEGQVFPTADGCNTCTCATGGQVICTTMPCYE